MCTLYRCSAAAFQGYVFIYQFMGGTINCRFMSSMTHLSTKLIQIQLHVIYIVQKCILLFKKWALFCEGVEYMYRSCAYVYIYDAHACYQSALHSLIGSALGPHVRITKLHCCACEFICIRVCVCVCVCVWLSQD